MNKGRTFTWRLLSILVVLTMLIPATLFVAPVPVALADDTGWRNPTANQSDSGGDGNGFERNPTRAYTNGSGYAESRNNGRSGGRTDRHRYYNYGINIPAGSTIQGIEVRLDWWLDSTYGTSSLGVDLSWNGGSSWTSSTQVDTGESTSSSHTITLGGTGDTWGRTWSASDFSNGNFRVRLHSYSSSSYRDFRLDWVPVRITYEPPNTAPNAPTSLLTDGSTNPTGLINLNPVFSWSAFSDPDGDTQDAWEIEVNTASDFGGTVMWDSGSQPGTDSWDTYAGTIPLTLDGNTYYWRVRVNDGEDWSAWSATQNFTMLLYTPPGPPTGLFPTDGSQTNSDNPLFGWDPPDTTLTHFQVQLRTQGGTFGGAGSHDSGEQASTSTTLTTYQPTGWNLGSGTYCWHVRVGDDTPGEIAWGDWSAVPCFTVDRSAPQSTASTPADYVNSGNITVNWTASDTPPGGFGVDSVSLWYKLDTGGTWTDSGLEDTSGDPSGSFSFPPPGNTNGTYYFETIASDGFYTEPSPPSGNGDDWTIFDNIAPTSQANPPPGPINAAPIVVPWTGSDNASGIATNGVRLWYNFGGGSWTDTGLTEDSDDFDFTPPNGDGTYCFYTIATDNAGNAETAPGSADGCTVYRILTTIGDLVWLDTNGDGLQNDGSTGIDGVTVELYGDGGAPLLDTDVTSGGGLYLFEDLDADDYVVEVDGNSPPLAGYSATTPPTHDVSVGPGIDYEAADFGFGPFATIGDTIFEDDDRDGDHDSGEDGMPDITVWLYTDGNGNGLIDGSDGEIDDTVTDGDGLYTFRGVALGDYTVLAREDDPDLPGAFQPTGDNPVAVTVAVAGVAYADADIGFNTPPPETKLLYLRPGDLLDRNLPTGYHTTHQIDNNSNNTWVQAPTMEGLLQFSGGNIVVWLYMDPTSGFDIWGNENQPTAEVTLWYNGAMIGTPQEVNNMTGAGQFYPFYFTAPASIVPGGAFSLQVAVSDCSGTLGPSGNVVVSFDSAALNSRIELPVYSYIRVDQVGTYDGAYPGGIPISTFIQGGTAYVRVTASDPFGAYDISGAVLTVPGVVADAAMTEVDSSSSSKTFETALPGLLQADYAYTITVTEGLEGEVWDTAEGTFRFIVSDLGSSTKTVDQPTASPGDTLEYTIVLRNTGDLEATVDVDDVLPPNVTYVGGSVSGGTWVLGSNTIEYNGTVPDHDEVTISYEVTVNTPLDNGTVIANDVTIDDGFNSFETTPPAETTITSAPNLSTSTKDVDQATAFPGDTLEYTIVLVNTGDMNAYIEDGDPLLDPIPDNTNFNGGLYASSGDISHDTGFDRVEWYGIVPAGGSVTLRFRAQIDYPLDDGTVITNTAAVNEGVGFPIPNTYYPFDTTTVESAPDLESHSIKLVDRATASPDDILAYTVRLQNDGDMNAVDVEMTDVLPDDVTWGGDVFMSSTGGDYLAYTPGNRTVTWRGDVNAGENVQIFFRANVNSPLPNNSQIVNTAHVADIAGNFTPFDLDAFTTVESSPYLGNSTKDVDLTIAQPDDILTYDITLVNEGNAVADASLLDTLAAELENPVLISWDNGSAEIVGGNQISWTGQITPGQDVVISFQADLLPVLDNGIEVENTALVDDGVNAAFYVDPPAVTEITSAPDLDDSVKTVDHATASPGDELVYTIALDNGGNMVADTLVRDVLPNNVTFVGGLSATSGAPLPTYSSINNRVSWNGDVAPGTPITFSYRVQIATPLDDGTVILNDAEIDDGAHTPFETAPPAETTISSAPDLSTSFKWVDRTNASPDDLLHYRVTLINSGDMIATGVSLSDIMPTDVTFASGPFVTGNGSGGYNPVQRRVYWNGFVAPGDDVDVDYYVNVNTPLPNGTTLVNDALIAGDDFNDVTTNQVNTTVSSFHEFVLVKNAPSAVAAGGQIVYEIDYTVGGNEPANSVTITDSIPANTTYVADSCSGGVTCSESAGVINWDLGNLVPGDADTVQFTVDVAGILPDGTIITNTAHIHDADTESEDTAYTEVTSGHWFDVEKTDSVDPVAAGASLTYNVTWTLAGNEQAEDIIVTDTLPAEVSFVSASDGGAETSPGSGIVVWGPFAGPYNPDDTDTLTVLVTVDDPLPDGTPLDNFVEVADDGGVPGSDTEQTIVNSSHVLTVDKDGQLSVEAGGLITYSIDWTVDGNETALGVIVEDTTPVNTTFVSASGATTIDDPGVGSTGMVRWYLGDRTDDSGTVELVVRVDDPLDDGTDIDNLASIRDNNGGATDSDGHTTGVTSAHSFTLIKTAAPPSVPPEGVINYTIHWEVTGNEIAQNVTISDAIPLNTSFENCGACVFLGGYVQWNLGPHAPGDSGDVFFQARVDTPLPNGTIIANTAHVFDTNGGTPQQASDDTTVNSNHTLAIAKSDAPDPVSAGGQIVYTIDWAVYGNEPAPNVVIRDPVPTGASYDSCTGGCTTEGDDVVWYLGARNPGDSGTVQFTVDVDDVLDDGADIVNVATISDDDAGTADDTATTHTEVESSHAMSVDKSAPATVNAGGTLNYSIVWTLGGNERSDTLTIVDTLPDDVSYVSSTDSGVHSGDPTGGTVTWNLGERTPADGDTFGISVDVASPLPDGTILLNQVDISDSNGGTTDSDTAQTTVNSSHILDVSKSGPDSVNAGDQIFYTINWSISGNEDAEDVIIEDVVPENATFFSASGATTIDDPGAGNRGLVRWHLGDQAHDASGSVQLRVVADNPLDNGTVIVNTASIADSNGGTTAEDDWSTTINSSHGFVLTKSDLPDPIAPNGIINYTIHWEVTGNEPAHSVVITDYIPANTTYQGCGGCIPQPTYARWNLGDRNPGDQGDLSLQVRVATPLADETVITNDAVIADNNGGTPANAQATTLVDSDHYLTLDKSAPSAVGAGDEIVYTIQYGVYGDEPALSVVITDVIPSNTDNYVCSGGLSCLILGNVATWQLGTLDPGQSGSVELTVDALDVLPDGTHIYNDAYIFDADDGYADDNTDTTVTSGHGFSISKEDDPDPVNAGDTLTYTITWSVGGSEQAQGVLITDTLPAEVTYISDDGGGSETSPGVVTWDLGGPYNPNNGDYVIVVTVQVDDPLPNDTVLENEVVIGDSNGGLPASASQQTTVRSSHTLDVDKDGPTNTSPDALIEYTIDWSVDGNEATDNLVIEDNTPDNTTFFSAEGTASIDDPGMGNSGLVRWHLDEQLPGASGTVTLTVRADTPLGNGTIIENEAAISDDNDGATDSDTVLTTVGSSHGFVLDKDDHVQTTIAPDQVINYTIHWRVTGNEPAQNVAITDSIPLDASFESCGACVLQGDYVRWNLGVHNPGDEGDVFLQVRVDTPLPDGTVITNTAYIFDENDGLAEEDTTHTTVSSDHDLVLDKQAPSAVAAGDEIGYTIGWSITGDEPAFGVVLTDTVPVNTTLVSIADGGVETPPGSGLIVWNLGDQEPGDTGAVHFTVQTISPLPDGTDIVNTAYASDDDGKTGEDSAVTEVTSGHGFDITKSDSVDPVDAGDPLEYTIEWSVTGNEPAEDVIVQDTLPDDVTFVSASPGGAETPPGSGIVVWNLAGPYAPGEGETLTITVDVDSPLANNTQLLNAVTIEDANGGMPGSDTETTLVHSDHALQVSKISLPNPVSAGGQITYTINYTVTGNEPAPGVRVEDVVPEHTTFAWATPGYSLIGTLVRWDLGDLDPGDDGTLILVVTVDSPLPSDTTIYNSVFIEDEDDESDSDTEETSTSGGHTLSLSKTGMPNPINPDQIINYTIHWEVSGNEPAQNVVILDPIPANTQYASGGVLMPGNYVQWNLGSHNPGDSGDVTLQVRVDTPLPNGTIITNIADISDGNGGAPDTATTTTTVESDHSLGVSKSAPSAVEAGGQIVYTIDYAVYGNEPAVGVIITDRVPANTSYTPGTCQPSGTCSEADGVVTWDLGNLIPSSGETVQYTADVMSPLPDGTVITNTAYISDGDGKEDQSTAYTIVTSGHGYSIAKSDDGYDPVQAGGQIVYVIDWALSGSENAEGVTIEDTLPGDVSFVSATDGGTHSGELTGGTVTWNLGDQTAGASGTVNVTVDVDEPLDNNTLLENLVQVSDDNGGLPSSDTEQTTVNSAHTLDVEKSANAATVQAGGQIMYTIAWAVDGNETAQNVVIVDNTPGHTTFVTADSSPAATIQTPGLGNSGPVRWLLGNQLPGATGVVTLVVDVADPLDNGTVIPNTATIGDDNGGNPDDSDADVTVESAHQLDVNKSGEGSVVAGQIVHYTIGWNVSGNEAAYSVVITDQVPANTTFVNCSGGDSCNHALGTGIVTWQLGNRDPGASGNVNLQVQTVSPLPNGTQIENTAYIFDSNAGGSDESSWITLVGSGHTFNLNKVGAPDPVEAGGLLNYSIEYEVVGNETAYGVVITDRVPVSTTLDWIGDGGTQVGGVISWTLGDLDPGNTGSVHFRVRVDTPLPNGVYVYNDAVIYDTNGGYAETSDETLVHSDHTLQVSKSDDPDPVQADSLLTYTIHYRVMGNEPAPNVVIQDDVPADTTFVSASGGTFDGSTVRWELGNLVPGDEGDVIMVVRTDALLPDGTFIFNQAYISDDDGAFAASLQERTTLQSTHDLHLEKYDTGYDPVQAGAELVYTIHYAVTGQELAEGVTIQDDIPANTGYVSCDGGTLCSMAGNRVTWFIGDVLPGESGAVTLTLQTNSPLDDGTVIYNEATINDDNGGVPTSADEETLISSGHDLAITKVDLEDPVPAGHLLTYHINYEVLGNQTAHGVVITDQLPSGVVFQSASGTYTGPDANGVMTWTLGNLAPGAYGPIVVTVRPDSALPDGTVLVNTAAIFDDDGYRAEVSETTTVVQAVLDASTKMVDKANAAPDEQLQYTIRLVNEGGKDAQAVNVQDVLPGDVTYLSGPLVDPPDAGDGYYDYTHRTIVWNGDLNAGAVVSLTYSVWVNNPLDDGTIIENTAELNYQGTRTLGPISTTIHSAPDLTNSTKTVDRAFATAGEEVEYTITLVNDGNMNGDAVWMTDTLPANVTYEDDLWWSHGMAAYASGVVTWTGQVNVGEPATIRYKVRLADTLVGGDVITNVATVNDGFAGHAPFEIGPAVTEIGSAFSVSIDDGRETVVPGEFLTYTITFRGEDPVDDGAATALIPEHTQFYAATGNHSANGQYVNWNLDPLGSNFEESVLLVVLVDPVLPNLTLIENHATFTGEGESVEDDDTTTVTSAPDMSTSVKQVDKKTAFGAQTIVYTIILSNTGTMHASTVIMTDTIPEYTSYVLGSVSGGSYDPAAQAITWEGPLNVGDSVGIQFSVLIAEPDLIPPYAVVRNVALVDDGYDGHKVLTLQADDTVIEGGNAPDRYKIHMPIIFRAYEYILVPDIELVIMNCGDTDAFGTFLIDLYIDPDESSSYWPISYGEGYQWFGQEGASFDVGALAAGQSLTLYLDDAKEGLSNSLPVSPTLYAQVDWWKDAVSSGVVDEGTDGEENNVADSNGSVCNATPGKPDLIVVSIRRVSRLVIVSNKDAGQQMDGTQFEGILPAPPRPQPPQP